MIIKFDSKLSAVSCFKYYFLHEASQFVSLQFILMSANFNSIRFYSQWSSAVLLGTL